MGGKWVLECPQRKANGEWRTRRGKYPWLCGHGGLSALPSGQPRIPNFHRTATKGRLLCFPEMDTLRWVTFEIVRCLRRRSATKKRRKKIWKCINLKHYYGVKIKTCKTKSIVLDFTLWWKNLSFVENQFEPWETNIPGWWIFSPRL